MRNALPTIFLAFALAACSGGGLGSRSGFPAAPNVGAARGSNAATNWNVQTGATNNTYAFQALDYYPNNITIDAGDTVTFAVAGGTGGDAHTVSFVPIGRKLPSPLDPKDQQPAGGNTITGKKFMNSGILVGGQTFAVNFPKAGTYRILCLFHEPAMESTVVVQPAGTAYPHSAHYYHVLAESEQKTDVREARAAVKQFPFTDGGTTLAAGIDPSLVQYPPSDVTVLRYLNTDNPKNASASGNLTIKAGTVVTFINETSNEPHTVTLNVAGQKGLPRIPPDPPVNASRHGITTYDGSKVVNSGTFLGGGTFRIQFTKPGTYFYGCVYHFNSGMVGTITVTS